MPNDKMRIVVLTLEKRLGRMPTEEEVKTFIFGSRAERQALWADNTKENSNEAS